MLLSSSMYMYTRQGQALARTTFVGFGCASSSMQNTRNS